MLHEQPHQTYRDMRFWMCLVAGVAALAIFSTGSAEMEERDGAAEGLMRRDGLIECKELGLKCNALFRCCGRTHCYWPNGFTLRQAGKCVKCIEKTQKCQRDVQCCEPLMCQKRNAYHTDGVCEPKYAPGSDCHDNDQCLSNRCKISYLNDVLGYGGKCA